MCCTDAFWWYSHIIERVKKPQTVIYAWGRQTVLPFHFKENLTTGSGFTGRQVQWLNQSWSQRTRGFTKLQLMLPCVSIVREKIKASSTPAVTSVGYFSVWGMKVEEEVKAKHSFVSQPKCLSEFFGKTLVCNFNFTLIWMVITKGYIQIMCLTLTKLTSYHYNPWTVNVCANIYNLAESELHPSSLFMPEFLEYKLCIFCKSCENQKHAPSCQHSTVLQKHFWKIPTWEIAEKSREEDFKGKDWQHVFFKCLTEGKINL